MTQEALKLALEALKEAQTNDDGMEKWDRNKKAIIAIEEALAQPERHELQAKGEHPAPCARHCEANAFQIVIKNLKAQLAQPEQEPVCPDCKAKVLYECVACSSNNYPPQPGQEPVCDKDPQGCWNVRCQLGKKCKNTPPQRTWVGLTEDERNEILINAVHHKWDDRKIVKDIEDKLKEKNNGQ